VLNRYQNKFRNFCRRATFGVPIALAIGLLSACASIDFYWQAAKGHSELLSKAKPIEQWLAATESSPALRIRLEAAQQMRRFAVQNLALPDNASYTRYADLGRPALLWNVVAAHALSLKPKTWCFPIAGCVSYKGFFDLEQAKKEATSLQGEGFEVIVYPVRAYSTLGWGNWLGGDPLLNTFLQGPAPEVARLIFHELAHQVVYVEDDSSFNEAFATSVETLGGAAWLAAHATHAERQADEQTQERRKAFRVLTNRTRGELSKVYDAFAKGQITAIEATLQKEVIMADLRQRYATLQSSWGGYKGYDTWVNQANNASFVSTSTYEKWVPAFVKLFEQQNKDWPKFYDAVAAIARLPPAQRQSALEQLSN
jgi:predicted aminopeptidase